MRTLGERGEDKTRAGKLEKKREKNSGHFREETLVIQKATLETQKNPHIGSKGSGI